MNLARILSLVILCAATAMACSGGPSKVNSQAVLEARLLGPATGRAGRRRHRPAHLCPNGFPCDAFANAATYGDPRPDMNKRLTVIWTCQPQRFVLSEVAISGLKCAHGLHRGSARSCRAQSPSWKRPGARAAPARPSTSPSRCATSAARTRRAAEVPAMAYIFGNQDPNPKKLRIRFTCNGQTTPGQQSMENGVVDLRCERNADLGY